MQKKIIMTLVVFLAVGGTFCTKKKEEAAPKKNPVVHEVKMETLKPTTVEDFYEAVGTVRSKTTSVLSSRVMGHVLAIHVREGDQVQIGQLLMEMDDRDAAVQLRKAQAGLREAQDTLAEMEQNIRAAQSATVAAEANKNLATSTFNRYRLLFERKSVSPQEFEEVQARYQARTAEADRTTEMLKSTLARREQVLAKIEQAKAEVTNAQVFLGYTRIHSPIGGLVTVKQAEVGGLAVPGTPLLTIEDSYHYRLEALVEESQMGKIRMGMPVGVHIDSLGEKQWAGRVVEIGPSADPATRSTIVKVELPAGSRPGLRSGLFGRARFSVGQRKTLMVPQSAVIQQGQLTEIYVMDPTNTAHLRLIKTGRAYGNQVEVLSGIRDGERIIVEGVEKVGEGTRVE